METNIPRCKNLFGGNENISTHPTLQSAIFGAFWVLEFPLRNVVSPIICGIYLDPHILTSGIPSMYEPQTSSASHTQTEPRVPTQMGKKNKILVFSPDRDLAQSLSMLFENHFEIACETSLVNLQRRIASVAPALLVVDLHPFSSDVMHELNIVEANSADVPVVVLRAYNRLRADVEELVQRTADVVFYKPLNAEEVVRSIHELLKVVQ